MGRKLALHKNTACADGCHQLNTPSCSFPEIKPYIHFIASDCHPLNEYWWAQYFLCSPRRCHSLIPVPRNWMTSFRAPKLCGLQFPMGSWTSHLLSTALLQGHTNSGSQDSTSSGFHELSSPTSPSEKSAYFGVLRIRLLDICRANLGDLGRAELG